jgi:hypothetical protein
MTGICMSKHRYERWFSKHGQTRLVTFQALAPEEELRCKIEHTSLDNNPDYEAPSHAWGEQRTFAFHTPQWQYIEC